MSNHPTLLNLKRQNELNRVKKLSTGFTCQGVVGEFFDLYIRSEVFAKKIQDYYHRDKKNGVLEFIDLRSLKPAMKYFKLKFPTHDITMLFKGGNNGKEGEKSARQLRNGYIHSLNENDKQEIIDRAPILIPKLKQFLMIEL